MQKSLGDQWKGLSKEEKAVYQERADEMQAARTALSQTALQSRNAQQEADAQSSLSVSQIKRLNGARLEKSLNHVAEHPAWHHGLGLGDHISALRAELVMDCSGNENRADLRAEFDAVFGFDTQILSNPKKSPPFLRACVTAHAGLCCAEPHFSVLQKLASEFDTSLHAKKLGTSPSLVRFVSGDHAVWLLLSAVMRRPVSHVGTQVARTGSELRLKLRNGRLQVCTVHQLLRTLLSRHVAGGEAADQLGVEAVFTQ